MTNLHPRRTFRLPHETHDAPTTAMPRPRVRTTAHAGHDDCAVSDVAARRRSAHRTVASLTTGIALATGAAALGMGWVAQQATAATTTSADADSSVVDRTDRRLDRPHCAGDCPGPGEGHHQGQGQGEGAPVVHAHRPGAHDDRPLGAHPHPAPGRESHDCRARPSARRQPRLLRRTCSSRRAL